MGRLRRALLRPSLAGVALVLAACSDTPLGYVTALSGDGKVAIAQGPLREGLIVLTVQKVREGPRGAPIHARPGGAVLKLAGFLPVGVSSMEDGGATYVVAFEPPADALRAVRASGGLPLAGELFVPVDHGVRSFTGIERHVPDTAYATATIRPQERVPLPWLAESIGAFLRGLYSAR